MLCFSLHKDFVTHVRPHRPNRVQSMLVERITRKLRVYNWICQEEYVPCSGLKEDVCLTNTDLFLLGRCRLGLANFCERETLKQKVLFNTLRALTKTNHSFKRQLGFSSSSLMRSSVSNNFFESMCSFFCNTPHNSHPSNNKKFCLRDHFCRCAALKFFSAQTRRETGQATWSGLLFWRRVGFGN